MSELKGVLSFAFDRIFGLGEGGSESNSHFGDEQQPQILGANNGLNTGLLKSTSPNHKILTIDAGSSKFKTCFFDLEKKDAFRCDEASSDRKAMYTTVALIFSLLDSSVKRIQVVNQAYPLSHHVSLNRGEAYVFFYNWKNLVFPITDMLNERKSSSPPKKDSIYCDEKTLLIGSENIEIAAEGVHVRVNKSHVEKAKLFTGNLPFIYKVGDKILFSKEDIVRELFHYCIYSHAQLPNGVSVSDCYIFASIPSKVLFREREMLRDIIKNVSKTENVHLVKEAVALCYYFYFSYNRNEQFEVKKENAPKAVAIDIGHYSSDIAVMELADENSIRMNSAYCLYHGGHKLTIDLLNIMKTQEQVVNLRKNEEEFWKEVSKTNECKETIFNLDSKWNTEGDYESGQDGCIIDNIFLPIDSIKLMMEMNFSDIIETAKKLVVENSSQYLILGGPVSKTKLFRNYIRGKLGSTCEIVFTKNLFDICIGTFLYACNRISQPLNFTLSQSSISDTSVLSSPSSVKFTNLSPIDHVFLFTAKAIVCTKVPEYINKRFRGISREMYNQMIEDIFGLEKTKRLNMYNLEDKNVLDIDTRQERPTRPIVSYFSLEGDQEYIDIEIYNATLEDNSILKHKRDMAVKGFYFDPKYQRNYRRIYTRRGAEIFGLQEFNFVRRVKIVGFPRFNQKRKQIKKLMKEWGHTDDEIDFCLASCRFDYQIDSDDNLIIQVSNLIEAINFSPIEIHTSSMIPCTIKDALSEEVQDKFDQIEELVVNIDLKDDVIEYLEKSKSVSALRFSGRANGKTLRTRGLDILALMNDMSSTSSEALGEAESDHLQNKRDREEFEQGDVYNTSPQKKYSPPQQKPSPPLITKSVTFRTQEQVEEYFD